MENRENKFEETRMDESETIIEPEKSKEIKQIENLVFPKTENSALLYERIYAQVYAGEKDPGKREKILKKFGWNTQKLKEVGKHIKKVAKIFKNKQDLRGMPDESIREESKHCYGLTFSETKSGKKIEHTELSVGLADKMVYYMRKIILATLETDQIQREKIIETKGGDSTHRLPELDRASVKDFLSLKKNDEEYLKRTNDVFNIADNVGKGGRYRLSLDILEPLYE